MRSYVHTGGNYRNFYGNSGSFHKWRVYLDGHLRYNFIGKHNSAHGSPFNYNILDFVNFDNPDDIERFKSDMLVEIEKAKKFPDKWKEEKSRAIKAINYAKKNWPKDFTNIKKENMKALIRYVHGTPPHAVMSGTEEQLVAALSEQFDVMEHNGFYFDKKDPRKSPPFRMMMRGPHPPHDYYVIVDADKWQNKQDKTKLTEIDVPADGRKRWGGGAWVIAFVYSNKGNFVLKGYHREVEDHLTGLVGLKYFVNYTMWSGGQHRDWWQVSAKDVRIEEPNKRNKFRWTITKRSHDWRTITEIKFKRLPKSWVPEIDALTR